jgi:LmbE family N-acetylglucosaminyl deacetylase
MTLFFIFLFIILQLVIIYLVIIRSLHKNNFPKLKLDSFSKKSNQLTKVLVIYPHPDDETMASGGLIRKLSNNKKFDTEIVTLTSGEKGTELLKVNPEILSKIRQEEFKKAVNELGIKKSEVWNFKDAKIHEQYTQIKEYLRKYLIENNFDLVVTYERSGMYGHPDHVNLSKMVHELQNELKTFKVLYSTLPKNILDKANLPTQLTIDDEVFALDKLTHQEPQYRVSIFKELFAKYKAAKRHKSQKLSGSLPLWFEIAVMPYEYYTEKYE